MLLSPDDAELFFKLHRSLMCFVNERLQVISDIDTPDEFSALPPEARLEVRNAFLDETDLIELFVDANPFDLSDEELDVVRSWRHQVAGKFYIFRYLKKYTVFLSTDDPAIAYGVVALTDSFEDLVGPHLPILVETVLVPLGDKIIYDGLVSSYNITVGGGIITFGGGIKRSLNESYKLAKERLGIVTSLPLATRPVTNMKPKKARKKPARRSGEAKDILEVIVGMTDQFCREHLNDEYATLCRKLAETLARKRPSPLLSGRPTTWASGIVRTIGWVNYLDDSTTEPHMKLTAIDKAFGVGESTGQGKSKAIRTMLKIRPFDMDWTLPSRMDDNPIVWMLEVNGFLMDVRHAPREVQEIAFEKGLIPYIPADRLGAEVM
jgi:hypothetical protein